MEKNIWNAVWQREDEENELINSCSLIFKVIERPFFLDLVGYLPFIIPHVKFLYSDWSRAMD